MNDRPQTRAEARADEPVLLEAEFVEASPGFLPLNVRRVMYVLGVAGLVTAPFFQTAAPELAIAIQTGASLLGSVALGAALANPTR